MTDKDEKNKDKNPKEEDIELGWEEATHDVPKLPKINVDRDFVIAKSYLQEIGSRNETVWGHLNDIIAHVLKERPPDCLRYFEDTSRELRIRKFFLNKEEDDIYKEVVEEPKELDEAKQLLHLYRRVECLYDSEFPYDERFGTLDFFPTFKLLEEAGVGFPHTDIYNIQMSIRLLAKLFPIENLKFWGKVLGTVRDYIIVEAELTQDAMSDRYKEFTEKRASEVAKKQMEELGNRIAGVQPEKEVEPEEADFGEEAFLPKRKLDLYVSPPLPVAVPPEVVVVPSEPPGHGVNRKVYYASNYPSEGWHELPDVTPEQIVKARMLRRFMTGIINSEVPGFPTFPGTEKEFLRAQIARITHSTHASPLGFYTSGGEEEAVDVEEGQLYTENMDYQPLPVRDLLDPTLEFWVHHEPYILPQGRTEFWQDSADAQEFEMEEMGDVRKEIEKGPPILSTLSGDAMLEPTPCWAPRRASTLMSEDTVVVLRSNLWPGALTALKDRFFVNFYVGWAAKGGQGFNPYMPSNFLSEYETGPEIMEMADPTVEMEEFRWMMLHPKIISDEQEEEEDRPVIYDEEADV